MAVCGGQGRIVPTLQLALVPQLAVAPVCLAPLLHRRERNAMGRVQACRCESCHLACSIVRPAVQAPGHNALQHFLPTHGRLSAAAPTSASSFFFCRITMWYTKIDSMASMNRKILHNGRGVDHSSREIKFPNWEREVVSCPSQTGQAEVDRQAGHLPRHMPLTRWSAPAAGWAPHNWRRGERLVPQTGQLHSAHVMGGAAAMCGGCHAMQRQKHRHEHGQLSS